MKFDVGYCILLPPDYDKADSAKEKYPVVYYLHGVPEDLFVPIFAIGRVPGWTVQVLEQLEQNILIRPLTLYTGPQPRPYVPIGERQPA